MFMIEGLFFLTVKKCSLTILESYQVKPHLTEEIITALPDQVMKPIKLATRRINKVW